MSTNTVDNARKVTTMRLREMKQRGEKIAMLTAYDYSMARLVDEAGIDVILVGEMRDLETISTAITAAETGHLVFGTLHTKGAINTIDRIIDVFPADQQEQIRTQLADVIECAIGQTLLPKIGGGRCAAFEIMVANSAIRNLIRQKKTFQIASTMQTSKKQGMQLLDDALMDLVRANKITRAAAAEAANDPSTFLQGSLQR